MNRLLHYSDKPVTFNPSHVYAGQRGGFMKPSGLWVSVEGECDWPWWCRGEDFHLDGLAHAYEVELSPAASVLRIESIEEFDEFHRAYCVPRTPSENPRWEEVASLWDGIVIAPYQWDRRMSLETLWYYGWDCSSGVIWNLRAVAEFREAALQESHK